MTIYRNVFGLCSYHFLFIVQQITTGISNYKLTLNLEMAKYEETFQYIIPCIRKHRNTDCKDFKNTENYEHVELTKIFQRHVIVSDFFESADEILNVPYINRVLL